MYVTTRHAKATVTTPVSRIHAANALAFAPAHDGSTSGSRRAPESIAAIAPRLGDAVALDADRRVRGAGLLLRVLLRSPPTCRAATVASMRGLPFNVCGRRDAPRWSVTKSPR